MPFFLNPLKYLDETLDIMTGRYDGEEEETQSEEGEMGGVQGDHRETGENEVLCTIAININSNGYDTVAGRVKRYPLIL